MLPIDLIRRADDLRHESTRRQSHADTSAARRRSRRGQANRSPILLIETRRQRRVIAACCERALNAGVRVNMPLSDARALLPFGLARVIEASPRRDRTSLRRIAERMIRFSPIVSPYPPDAVLLDITGCDHLFGGERAMRLRVCRWLDRQRLTSRVSVASTVGCAWAVARYAGDDALIVPDQGELAAMEALPIAALRLPAESIAGFAELAIENVGQLVTLPRALVPPRFGLDALRNLDAAIGNTREPVEPLRPPEPIRVECVFEGPTTRLDSLEHATRDVIRHTILKLRERSLGITRLELELARADLPPERLSVVLSCSSTDARHLWKLIAPRLERLQMGFGITGVSALAAGVSRVRPVQSALPQAAQHATDAQAAGASGHEQAFSELVDTLTNRIGAARVLKAELVESHIPERGVRWCSILDATHQNAATTADRNRALIGPMRPTLLFHTPEPARAITIPPDALVRQILWRSQAHDLLACIGPERIAPEWWRGSDVSRDDRAARDYFRVQRADGLWLWLFREQATSRWFVHGVWA